MSIPAPIRAAITMGIPALLLKVIAGRSGNLAADIAANGLIFGIVGMLLIAGVYFALKRLL